MGMGSLAFASLFGGSLVRASEISPNPLLPKEPHFYGKAKHVIHIFCFLAKLITPKNRRGVVLRTKKAFLVESF